MRGRILSIALFGWLLATASASAHELKVLFSQAALPEQGGKVTVYLGWGHHLPVGDLIDAQTIGRYDYIAADGAVTPLKPEGISLQARSLTLSTSGVHQVVATRRQSMLTWIKDDQGNRNMKRGPKSEFKGQTIDSSIRSNQCAKAIALVGAVIGSLKPLGMPAEFVLIDAADLRTGKSPRLQLLIEGKPVEGVAVQVRRVGDTADAKNDAALKTGTNGEVELPVMRSGTWVIEASYRRAAPAELRDQFDDDSFLATLSFQINP